MTPQRDGHLDPIALEIQWQRLIAIMDEVDNATVRTSFSTIVGESRDFRLHLGQRQRGVAMPVQL